ncbi:Na+/H+ antiporter subunit D [Candidatus Leptofilum sp.]|uniref:Na+/H+ antiporter subunit D n=1 Tax=Candidatus Leptofilum sp. TaxID=3241576 RepID=UPI003B59412C
MIPIKFLLLLPILVPFFTGILAVLSWHQRQVQRALSVAGSLLLLLVAGLLFGQVKQLGPQAVQIGNWQAPFGITLYADLFTAIMLTLAALMGLVVGLYSLANIDDIRQRLGFYPLYQMLLMGVCGSFLAGDVFNLYVWFEVMLIASFVLLALGSERRQLEGAIKYVTLNLMASAIFLAAVGILYGVAGSLNMADLALRLRTAPPGVVTTLAMMFLVAFGIKAALFPLFSWLPAAYHTPPTAVSAIFAGLLTKVGVYAIIRVFTLLFVHDLAFTNFILLILAGLTMVTGVLGAASQNHYRRILSFHISSQIGYMVMGLALFTPLALAGAIFYIIHHIIVKTNLFLISGITNWVSGSYELKKLGGLYVRLPLLAGLFLLSALSLAGIPPLSGFWAKFTLIKAGLEVESYAIVFTALAVSLLTLYSMIKIWTQAYWKQQPEEEKRPFPTNQSGWVLRFAPVVLLAACTVTIGLGAEYFLEIATTAAEQLLNPALYVQTVLGQAVGGLP